MTAPLHSSATAKPFVKWAGGKRFLLPELLKHVPASIRETGTYYEPFAGGAALFFAVRPKHGFLSDLNAELMEAFWQVKVNVEAVITELQTPCYANYAEAFYEMRGHDTAKWHPCQRAARFIYMNKVCFNGLYRVNSKGKFNAPFGKYANPTICDEATLRACSEALQNADAHPGMFDRVLLGATPQDFVYFDPPYDVISKTANFTSYTSGSFRWEDQLRLHAECCKLQQMGVPFLLSNAATDRIRDLYVDFHRREVQAPRAINSKSEKRGLVSELLIYNRPIHPAPQKHTINCPGCPACWPMPEPKST